MRDRAMVGWVAVGALGPHGPEVRHLNISRWGSQLQNSYLIYSGSNY